jgi:hypothetical protein
VQTLLSFGALALAISVTTFSAAAECWCSNGPDGGYVPYITYVVVHHVTHHPVHQAAERPQNKMGPRPAHAHDIAKRPKPQGEEKAPPAGPLPTLPLRTERGQ